MTEKTAAEDTADGATEEEQQEEVQSEPIPLQRYLPLYERNQDYFAWITIPGTKIDYPVMYNHDQPQLYLNHDFDGNRSNAGVLFLDSDCDPNGKHYIVYGHNMSNGTMFGGLLAYRNKSYWEKHSTLSFDTLYEERTYVIAIAMRARVLDVDEQEGFRYYFYTSLDTEEVFEEYMRQVRKLTLYDTGIDISFGDELLVLSTCHHYTKNGRFVVIAKRIA